MSPSSSIINTPSETRKLKSPPTCSEQGWGKFHKNKKHINISINYPSTRFIARAEEENRPRSAITLSVSKLDGKKNAMQISPSSQAKDLKEFHLWLSHKETGLQTMKICAPSLNPDCNPLQLDLPTSRPFYPSNAHVCVIGNKAELKRFWKISMF